MSSNRAFVALGSNLGNPVENIERAIRRLAELSSEPVQKSSLWRSTPVDCPVGSADFVNAVVALVPRPQETPESLLGKLQQIEREFGRVPKKILNEPRPLDLDLLTFGDETQGLPELTLPHPRAHLRRFVLQPLAEIAPDLLLPGQTQSAGQLLAALRSDEIVERIAPGAPDDPRCGMAKNTC